MKLMDSLSIESIAALPQRERRLLIGGGVLAVLLFILGVLVPLDRSVAHAQQRLAKKRADLVWMQAVAPELAGSEPGAAGSLSVRLEKAPFDALVNWLARLSAQNGVSIESATIEKAGPAGQVNAAIVLRSG